LIYLIREWEREISMRKQKIERDREK
jgi:hypothetical protein